MKSVMITGGARGIGRSIAEKFLSSNQWTVSICDIDEAAVHKTGDELNARYQGRVLACGADVTNRSSMDHCVKRTLESWGRVDCLINNAGITRDAMVYKMQEADWQKVLQVNLTGVFNTTQAVLPTMIEKGSGSIINTASVVGLYGNVGQSNYVATKAAVIGMTKTWAKELGRKGIRVNAVAPGFTLTEMVKTVPEKVLSAIAEKTPLQRLGQPEEIAAAFYFLASDDSSFITGHCLSVDGGLVV